MSRHITLNTEAMLKPLAFLILLFAAAILTGEEKPNDRIQALTMSMDVSVGNEIRFDYQGWELQAAQEPTTRRKPMELFLGILDRQFREFVALLFPEIGPKPEPKAGTKPETGNVTKSQ